MPVEERLTQFLSLLNTATEQKQLRWERLLAELRNPTPRAEEDQAA